MSSLLASLLALGVVGVRVDALAVGGLADVEGDGLNVLAGVGNGIGVGHEVDGRGGRDRKSFVVVRGKTRLKCLRRRLLCAGGSLREGRRV